MYERDGLGFWTELFKMGAGVLKTVAVPALSLGLQTALTSRMTQQQQMQQQVQQYPNQQQPLTYVPQTQIINGVPNVVLFGGFALVAVALIMRRR